ncbi:hypothetical protein SAMN06296010_1209 [Agreia pratensis]|uniref:Uncharacterized protein n=1 Tax=Agreia pratensis TaxID=150121 RepID=A0A1X7JC31_9MICO|nr:hypothetical protein SAMN06296010_1209 [Agreia pratensis]
MSSVYLYRRQAQRLRPTSAAHRGKTATANSKGTLLMNGVTCATLSGAVRFLQGGGAIADWQFWCVDSSFNRTVAHVRADIARTVAHVRADIAAGTSSS